MTRRALASTAYRAAVRPFKLADIGEGITEVEIIKWSINEGAHVEEFDSLCEVQSDKATVDITSPFKGTVSRLYAQPGQIVKVGTPLCDVDDGQTSTSTPSAEPVPAPSERQPSSHGLLEQHLGEPSRVTPLKEIDKQHALDPQDASQDGADVHSTPAVRRLAKERGIDLTSIEGTGKAGRITKEDILRSMELPASTVIGTAPEAPRETETIPVTGMRRAMYKAMSMSLAIPHFAYSDELDVTALERVRTQLKGSTETKLTLLPLLIKALDLAMREHPLFASSLSGSAQEPMLLKRASHDISIALAAPSGLYTPLIANVDRKNVIQIADEVAGYQAIVTHAAQSRPAFTQNMLRPGTITLSNIGSVGGTYTHPVIPPTGQLAIGGLGRARILPRYVDADQTTAKQAALTSTLAPVLPVPRMVMSASFTADHRVVEGVELARFVDRWKFLVEHPECMLLELC
ncbi:uncharacterized protein L969DRAFT_95310 [Mixia osmundae IAM 14324]|uniref:Dihydrolipoamide acetyltransferase component of pyruvate dehydrogenase complex n=1 Tax=Mixia osmundae (strain CBS 9802 / IAM 14324 / JCM 22182 / KY 12970) TaxID=764103 RepID=G7DYZ9_MIXOS|nr:uncharacterized protein L969DRAFT_95310 [Mixia osmundae IAM 14324]KEI38213.1 hypothetical protein L969DRAFT_95310 [Mixia osmundae IAM 14324]GAA95809.1 hypothetical protein E5Q_02466 [Mixia osmundae IAM 14324]